MQRREGTYLQALALPSHFWLLLLPFRLCTSISSVLKKNAEKGRSLPLSSLSTLSLLALASTFPLLHSCFKCFLLAFSSPQIEEKKNAKKGGTYFQAPTLPSHFWLLLLPFRLKRFLLASSSQIGKKKKKIHRKEKKCRKGRKLTFLLSLLHLG